jgi:hypothetical protein
MIEYTDGQFGAIAPAQDVLKHLLEQSYDDLAKVKAVHIGTPLELQSMREGRTEVQGMNERLAELEKEIRQLRPQGPIKVYTMEDLPK